MRERPVVANRLADPPRPQDPDQKGRPEHAEEERDRRRQQQRNHAPTAEVSASATRSSPTARLALTSTASPERARPETATTAPSASSTSITCARPAPASRAPSAIARAGADRDHDVDVRRHSKAPHLLVLSARVVAELEHLAQYGDASLVAREVPERAQRRRHRRRAGVVRVVDDRDAAIGAGHVHPPRRRHGARQAFGDPFERRAELERDGGGHGRVHRLPFASYRKAHGRRAPRRDQREARPQLVVEHDVDGPDGRPGHVADTHGDHTSARARRQRGREHVAGVENGGAVAIERLEELALHARDAFSPAEQAGVGHAHVRDHTHLRLGDLAQLRDVACEPGAHLDHDDLGVLVGLEQRERDAGFVVEGRGARRARGGSERAPRPEGPWSRSCPPSP